MIKSREHFNFGDFTVFERVVVNTPFKYEGIFENSGCFIHIKGNGSKLISKEENKIIAHQDSALLRCGTYYFDFHKQKEANEVEMIAVHFFPELIQAIDLTELPNIDPKAAANSKEIISKFIDSLAFYFDNPALMSNETLALKLKELVILLIQTNQIESISALLSDLANPQFIAFKKIIETHLFSNLSIEQLAKLSNLSLSSFKREFKKTFNDSPTNYINKRRIDKAKQLLTHSQNNISEIAYEVGFNDPLYFTRLFKKVEGIPPTQFRTRQ